MEVGVWLQFAELMQEIRVQGLSNSHSGGEYSRRQRRKACIGARVVFIGSFRGGDMTGVTLSGPAVFGGYPVRKL